MEILDELINREILKDITSREKLAQLVVNQTGVYIGFDPSASSLHLGNYIQITILKRFAAFGFKPFAVLGGATGMIGDPSGKSEERRLLDMTALNYNKDLINKQLVRFGLQVVDNYDFYAKMSFFDFLRLVGKNININYMLSKELVKNRLESGLSFTEFTYQLIQAWDFKCLYELHQVKIQIGGSDQWGNITTGIEMIRKTCGEDNLALGITTNLLLTSDGKKFGKSEGNAIWLDESLTSPFQMYQYLLNTTDEDVIKLCKWLTFLPLIEIDEIARNHTQNRAQKSAQLTLAYEVVKDIHSVAKAEQAKYLSNLLFAEDEDFSTLTQDEYQVLATAIPTFTNLEDEILNVLVKVNVATSRREAREFVSQGAIRINGKKILLAQTSEVLNGSKNFYLIRKGKRYFYLVGPSK